MSESVWKSVKMKKVVSVFGKWAHSYI